QAGRFLDISQVLGVAVVQCVVAREGNVDHHVPGQLALDAEGVLIGARRLIVQRVGGGALADVGEESGGGTHRGSQALGERIDQRIGTSGNAAGAAGGAVDVVVAGRRELAIGEAGLIPGTDAEAGISVAGGGIGLIVNPYASANHGILSQPVSEAETWRAGSEI